jgi:hypothetical protein
MIGCDNNDCLIGKLLLMEFDNDSNDFFLHFLSRKLFFVTAEVSFCDWDSDFNRTMTQFLLSIPVVPLQLCWLVIETQRALVLPTLPQEEVKRVLHFMSCFSVHLQVQ